MYLYFLLGSGLKMGAFKKHLTLYLLFVGIVHSAITHAYFQCISFFPGLQIIKNRLAYKLNHGLSNFTGLLPAVRSQGKFSHHKIALQTSCFVLTCLLKIIFQMKT